MEMVSIVCSAFRYAYDNLPELPTFTSVVDAAASNLPSLNTVKKAFHELVASVSNVVKVSLLCIGAVYFARKPPFFITGFIVGIAFDETIKETVDKVERIVKRNFWNKLAFFAFGLFMLTESASLLSFGYAAKLGSFLSLQSRPAPDDA